MFSRAKVYVCTHVIDICVRYRCFAPCEEIGQLLKILTQAVNSPEVSTLLQKPRVCPSRMYASFFFLKSTRLRTNVCEYISTRLRTNVCEYISMPTQMLINAHVCRLLVFHLAICRRTRAGPSFARTCSSPAWCFSFIRSKTATAARRVSPQTLC